MSGDILALVALFVFLMAIAPFLMWLVMDGYAAYCHWVWDKLERTGN